jgi:hypothetical protein
VDGKTSVWHAVFPICGSVHPDWIPFDMSPQNYQLAFHMDTTVGCIDPETKRKQFLDGAVFSLNS